MQVMKTWRRLYYFDLLTCELKFFFFFSINSDFLLQGKYHAYVYGDDDYEKEYM
jgi:hypothetical protein